MRIDVIETLSDLEAIRDNWDRVYMSDPSAQYFLSWAWLRAYFGRRRRWFILALREREPGSPYVAFFPLRLVTNQDPKTGLFTDDIIMGGSRIADYTGFLSSPAYEDRAIAGFAHFLRHQSWTTLLLENFNGSEERRDALIRALSEADVAVRRFTPVDAGIDQCICPAIQLPDSWEAYLETKMSSQTRQKLRRFLRQVEADPAFRITYATRETVAGDLDILFRLWRGKWAEQKGEKAEAIIASAREMLFDAFDNGDLSLPILWHGDRPLGALANLLDRKRKEVLFYLTGRDETWKTPSPGLVLHATAIRAAIAEGYRAYDFLRGNEPYKYAFGVEERLVSYQHLRSKTGRNLGDKLNLRSVDFVHERAVALYSKGEKALAEVAFGQVVATQPEHYGARFGLARLLFDRGRLAEAETAFHGLLDKLPDTSAVLLRLGDAQLAQAKFLDAEKSFAAAAQRLPNSCEALYKHGISLAAAQRKDKAIAILRALEKLNTDDPAHPAYRAKAQEALSKLAAEPGAEFHLPAIHPSGCPLALDLPIFGRDLSAKLSASVGMVAKSPQPLLVSELPQRHRPAVRLPGLRKMH